MNFFAFDFETANSKRDSACSIGITAIKDFQIYKTLHQLINPETDFNPYNIKVHGIKPNDVADAPTFLEYWPNISPIFTEKHLIAAHNLTFDKSVLKATLSKYNLELPHYLGIDTLQTSRYFYPNLPNHKLNTVANYLNIELNHHSADSDSIACAKILIHQAKEFGISEIKHFVKEI